MTSVMVKSVAEKVLIVWLKVDYLFSIAGHFKEDLGICKILNTYLSTKSRYLLLTVLAS
jgi:hypothetical protein